MSDHHPPFRDSFPLHFDGEKFAAVASVPAAYGRIDVLFNHAGSIVIKPILETTEEEWDNAAERAENTSFCLSEAIGRG